MHKIYKKLDRRGLQKNLNRNKSKLIGTICTRLGQKSSINAINQFNIMQ